MDPKELIPGKLYQYNRRTDAGGGCHRPLWLFNPVVGGDDAFFSKFIMFVEVGTRIINFDPATYHKVEIPTYNFLLKIEEEEKDKTTTTPPARPPVGRTKILTMYSVSVKKFVNELEEEGDTTKKQ